MTLRDSIGLIGGLHPVDLRRLHPVDFEVHPVDFEVHPVDIEGLHPIDFEGLHPVDLGTPSG